MEIVKEREAETTEEFELARKKARRARQNFERVKTERYRKFQECFEPVSMKIDEIYKVTLDLSVEATFCNKKITVCSNCLATKVRRRSWVPRIWKSRIWRAFRTIASRPANDSGKSICLFISLFPFLNGELFLRRRNENKKLHSFIWK